MEQNTISSKLFHQHICIEHIQYSGTTMTILERCRSFDSDTKFPI